MSNYQVNTNTGAGALSFSHVSDSDQYGKPGRRENVLLLVVLLLSVLIYAPTLRWLFDRWTMSIWHNGHGLFIPPIVAYLVWQKLGALRHLPREASVWGFALLVPALGLHVLDVGIHTEILSALSVIIFMPGLSLLFLGAKRTRGIAFLLFFLFFMLPLPLGLTQGVHLVLRDITAANIAWAIPKMGVPIFVSGTLIHLPNANLLVADACSGFSTLYAMTAVTCLIIHVSPHRSRALLVLFIAVPIAILANTLRSIILVLSVYWYDVEILETWIHSFSGIVSMILALAVVFWAGGMMTAHPLVKKT
ncbi:Eight transmembrane protein EpsH [hydrothermal vent metagenome]|uniref:Eight transmembrane protein EpsH n=1 Tax=hydrothermal vent metagenome TaxID=652676 RepID=A0A3B1CH45_9ZZZZ